MELDGRSPDWTDHNIHDPGITLLEAVAYTIGGLGFVSVAVAIARRRRQARASACAAKLRSRRAP